MGWGGKETATCTTWDTLSKLRRPTRKSRDACSGGLAPLPGVRHPAAPLAQVHGAAGSRTAQPFPHHKVARKRDPPGALSTGRDALPRVRSGKWLVRQRLPATRFLKPPQISRNRDFSNHWKLFFQPLENPRFGRGLPDCAKSRGGATALPAGIGVRPGGSRRSRTRGRRRLRRRLGRPRGGSPPGCGARSRRC